MYAGEVSSARRPGAMFTRRSTLHARAAVCVPAPGKVRRDRPLGSIRHGADHSARLAGCAFRSRCAHADETWRARDSTPAGGRRHDISAADAART